jgi:hypothetical protein
MDPNGRGGQAWRPDRSSAMAQVALASGIVQFVFPPAAIAAIVLGHLAVRDIRRTGQGGLRSARAGFMLGYLVCFLALLSRCG